MDRPRYVVVAIGWQVNRPDGRQLRAEEQPHAGDGVDPVTGIRQLAGIPGTHDGFSRHGAYLHM